jgi:hypothetical protein
MLRRVDCNEFDFGIVGTSHLSAKEANSPFKEIEV